MDSVGIFVTELVDNPGYPLVVLCSQRITDQVLELEGSALAFVVKLVVEGFSDVGVHVGRGESAGNLYLAVQRVIHMLAAGGVRRAVGT